jgi:hypothetical protein
MTLLISSKRFMKLNKGLPIISKLSDFVKFLISNHLPT